MEDSAFRQMVEDYKKELMDMARRKGVLGRQPAEAQTVAAEAVSAEPASAHPAAAESMGAGEAAAGPSALQTSVYPKGSDSQNHSGGVPDPPDATALELPARDIPAEQPPATPEGFMEGTGPIVNPPETEELALLEGSRQPQETYDAFIQRTPGRGSIKIQASMADQAYPVPGVNIVISKDFTDGTHVFHTAVTNADGIVDDLMLPAPPSANSQQPDTSQAPINPFSVYNITATKPGFRSEAYIQVPVFDGVKSIQPVRLVPQGVR